MKCVKYNLAGRELYLTFNGQAMFLIRDKYESASNMLDRVKNDTKESFTDLCDAVAILAEQGELVRRYLGYEPQEIITKEALEKLITPPDIYDLTMLLPRAVALGFGAEVVKESGEVDLVLAELNQKKTL